MAKGEKMALRRYLEMFAVAGLSLVFTIVLTLVIQEIRDSITDTSSPAYQVTNQSLKLFTSPEDLINAKGVIWEVLAILVVVGIIGGLLGYKLYRQRTLP